MADEAWIQELVELLSHKGNTMDAEITARAQYVSEVARRTVWIRKKTNHRWEAIDWMGRVISESRYRIAVEHDVGRMASMPVTNIYAIATIVLPEDRRPDRRHRAKGKHTI